MLICLNDLFACLGLTQTRKLLTNFSKNSFYLLPEPLRLGYFLTNYYDFGHTFFHKGTNTLKIVMKKADRRASNSLLGIDYMILYK